MAPHSTERWTGSPSQKELHLVSKGLAETGLGKAKEKGEEVESGRQKTAQAVREGVGEHRGWESAWLRMGAGAPP